MTVHLGLDIGTQSLKALLLDSQGAVIGQGAMHYAFDSPEPLYAEQAPEQWLAALRPAIEAAISTARVDKSNIKSLGVAGQLDGCVAVDAAGSPLSKCLIWMDRRAYRELDDISPALIRARTAIAADASHMAAKIRWLKRHLADRKRIARFHQPTSFVVEQLTGQAVMDPGVASTTMLLDAATGAFPPDLLALFDTSAQELPNLRAATELAGELNSRGAELTGLNRGIPVAVGTGDDFASVLGAGVLKTGTLVCNLGTAEVTATLVARRIVDTSGLLQTHPFLQGLHLIGHPGWLSGGAVHWCEAITGIESSETLDSLAAATPPGAGGVLFLPALSGAVTPEWIPAARGCFYGLSASHHRGHLARAVLEGCAFAMRDILERLRALEIPMDRVLLTGGGSRSRLWAQIRADVIGATVLYGLDRDTSALGAALLGVAALEGSGALTRIVDALEGPTKRIEPRPAVSAVYDRSYGRYRRLFEALRPLYDSDTHD